MTARRNEIPRIPFKVVHCTSRDDGHPETELENRHSRRGWQSMQFPKYPQELILQFDQTYEVRELRILSHQSRICSKIHVSMGSGSGIRNTKFKGLGCLTLDSNERSNFKARELKKVHVRAEGNMMKLSILQAHVNRINLFNQVAIIAVQILGIPRKSSGGGDSSAASGGTSYRESKSKDNRSMDSKTESKILALKDLKARAIADEDYDKAKKLKLAIEALEKIGPHLAMLERKKKEAVDKEDFDTAMAIKQEIQRIRSGKFGDNRRQQQPPPLAHQQQYNQYPPNNAGGFRGGPHSEHFPGGRRSGSFEYNQPPYQNNSPHRNQFQGQQQQQTPPGMLPHGVMPPSPQTGFPGNRSSGFNNQDSPVIGRGGRASFDTGSPHSNAGGPVFPANQPGFPGNGGGYRFPAEGAGPNDIPPEGGGGGGFSRDPNDDRPLPALRKKSEGEMMLANNNQQPMKNSRNINDDRPIPALANKNNRGGGGPDPFAGPEAQGNVNGDDMDPEQINEKDRGIGDMLTNGFDEITARCLLDSRWMLRERGIREMRKSVDEKGLNSKNFPALVAALKRLLSDKVPSLKSSGCNLLVHALEATSNGGGLNEKAVSLVPQLFTNLRSNKTRVRMAAMQAVQAELKHVPAAVERIVRRILKPLDRKDANKPLVLLSRGELLRKVLDSQGLDRGMGITAVSVMENTMPLLEHRDGKVRDEGVKIVGRLHALAGKRPLKEFLKVLPKGMKDLLEQTFAKNNTNNPQQQQKTVNNHRRSDSKNMNNSGSMPRSPAAGSNAGRGGGGNARSGGLNRPEEGPLDESADVTEEGYCQFCDFHDPAYKDENKMDYHYFSECPMLTCCQHCEEVVDIAWFTNHLLQECTEKDNYTQCETCALAIPTKELAAHQRSKKCQPAPAPDKGNRCPLCFENIPPWDAGWKKHLLDDKCPANPRTNGTNKRPDQGKETRK